MECRESADFLNAFHQKLRIYVKKNKPRSSVDFQKLTHHLNTVAKRAKRKNWDTSLYLKKVSEILIYTLKGKQKEIDLNPNQEDMFNFSPLDLEEDNRRHKPIDFTPRRDKE
ncbi:hypothetical protein SAMN05443144_1441 [Fodinibius roseus]|uniref:Uncharacterized protein n=2 Tax=Fodinibius roseus TaxID=1194090 RepID=A0A1M5LQM2_9BACT|nr:hypothetical protein SAMN05443144_1441 [Fodinibius roseus]